MFEFWSLGIKKEFTKQYTRGGAPLHELCSLSFVSLWNCVPVQIWNESADAPLVFSRYVIQKRRRHKASPVISTYVHIPTLALSKSGIRVEVNYFLSACQYKLPCLFTKLSICRNHVPVKPGFSHINFSRVGGWKFHPPLIKPCMRFSLTRLSDILLSTALRHALAIFFNPFS